MGGCGGLERTDYLTIYNLGGCGGLERTDLQQFLLLEDVVVLKELIFNSFYFVLRVNFVVVLKDLIYKVSTFGGCGGLKELILGGMWWS